ncbi:AAA family ATPase [Rhodohalobacter sp. 8-1]|uniref:AAA family ATPase n=1 Tax=Rhodohalobacter sp. 8-1 TaxID=3131972 RepID=UPI0030EB5BE8
MLKIEKDDKIYPFSKGILARSLLPTGLSIDSIYNIVGDVQQEYKFEEEPVSSAVIQNKVARLLVDKEMVKEKNRYLVSRKFAQIKEPMVILIGGVAGVGKSTVAAELADRLGIQRVIDTDEVREIMRYTLPEDLLPELHKSSFDAGEVVAGPDIKKNVLVGFSRQARMVNRGVRAYIERVAKEGIKTIFNGVHLVPGLMEIEQNNKPAEHFTYLLTLKDEQNHIRRFHSRAEHSYRKANRYTEKMKNIGIIQEYAIERAEESGTTMIENTSLDTTVTQIVDDLIDNLQDKYFHYEKDTTL